MNPDSLLKHFDQTAEAPDAVPRLRRFMLDLAVHGKLVHQDPNDEPASELLKRIEMEKEKITPHRSGSRMGSFDIALAKSPFEIPSAWKWVAVRRITADRGQKIPDKDFSYVDVSSIDKERGRISNRQILSPDEAPSRARKLVQIGDVIYSCVRPYLLNIGVVEETFEPEPIVSTAFAVLNGFGLVLPRYLWMVLRSPFFVACVEEKMRGQAYPAINDRDFAVLPIPLPPLAEQHRIVAKVDELMGLCDQVEAAQAKRERRRDRLVADSLNGLNYGASGDELRQNAGFYLNHIPRLTNRPEHIHQLRQTILNLAVRGKLIPQDPKDEPANKLLERIHIKKLKLLESGELKKDKKLWEGISNSPPHAIPAGWAWTRLQDVFEISRGGSPRPANDPRYFGGKIPWITVGEITKDSSRFLTDTEGGLTEEGSKKSRFVEAGDLLLTNSGATLGVPKISKIRGCINDGVAILRLFHPFNVNDFVYEFLRSQTYVFRRLNQGMGQPNLNTPIIAGWHLPLPPMAEQKRIVSKLKELMTLCDELEVRISNTTATRRQLVEATLHEAFFGQRELNQEAPNAL